MPDPSLSPSPPLDSPRVGPPRPKPEEAPAPLLPPDPSDALFPTPFDDDASPLPLPPHPPPVAAPADEPAVAVAVAVAASVPAAEPVRPRTAEEVVGQWRSALAASGGPDTLVSASAETGSWLDLSHAHPSGLAQLLAGRPTPLSSLIRDAAAHRVARGRARQIRDNAGELASQRGIRACYLAAGLAGWPSSQDPQVRAPVLLRGCAVRLRSAGLDYELHLDETAVINPELVRALAARHGVTIDGAELGGLAFGRDGFDPRPVFAWLEERCAAVPGFRIDRALVVATFTAGSGAVLADLDAATEAIGRHDLLARVVTGEGSPAPVAEPVVPPLPGSPGSPAAVEGHLVLDLDPVQRGAVEAAARGEHVVIEGPPGTGATQTLVASIVVLAARGKRVLVVTPRRTTADVLLSRLGSVGLADLTLDLQEGRESFDAPAELARSLEDAVAAPPRAAVASPSPGQVLDSARRQVTGGTSALHAVRMPWEVSAYQAISALCELTARPHPPRTRVRLGPGVLARIDAAGRERLRADLRAAAEAGAFTFTRSRTRWLDARLETVEAARRALLAATVVRDHLPAAREAMTGVCEAAGLRQARSAADWAPVLDLLVGVRSTLDVLRPAVFEHPAAPFVAAVDPDSPLPRGERRRLRKAALDLVRPGVHVPDLHTALVEAAGRRRDWAALTEGGPAARPGRPEDESPEERPHVPAGLTRALHAVAQVDAGLQILRDVFAGSDTPEPTRVTLHELEQRVKDLAADEEGALGQPRRAVLTASLQAAGLGPLVEDLRERRAPLAEVEGELDLAWWSSVLEQILQGDDVLRGQSRAPVLRLAEAEAAQLATAPDRVREAVGARARDVVGAHAAQVRRLRESLQGRGRPPGPAELVRSAGDLVHALRPVWLMSPDSVARALPRVGASGRPVVDVVVVDDAHQVSMPEVAAALSRGAQLLVAGDRRRLGPPDQGPSVMETIAPVTRVHRLTTDHRTSDGRLLGPVAACYPEGWTRTRGTPASPALRLDVVEDGVAVAPPGEELAGSADAEVAHVVRLVGEHAAAHPEESLLVVALDERHAGRIEDGLRTAAAERPDLSRWLAGNWSESMPEPFAVRAVDRVLGQERDAVIASIGLARTPHGRVLHRFGALDEPDGAGRLIAALSRARRRTTLVCCFGAADLVSDRLRGEGPQLLRSVLLHCSDVPPDDAVTWPPAAEVDALVADLRDRLVTAGLPVETGVGDVAWPLDVAVRDPRVPGRVLVGVDLDGPAHAAAPIRERGRSRAAKWERAGWVYCRVSVLDLFRDPAAEVERVRQAWFGAMSVLAATGDLLPSVPAPSSIAAAGRDAFDDLVAGGTGDETGEVQSSSGSPVPPAERPSLFTPLIAPDDADPGSGSGRPDAPGPSDDDRPVIPDRSDDDRDEGWGDRSQDPDDDRFLRERPPHWD